MIDVTRFYRSLEFHDAVMLIGSNSLLLEQRRFELEASVSSARPALRTRRPKNFACRLTEAALSMKCTCAAAFIMVAPMFKQYIFKFIKVIGFVNYSADAPRCSVRASPALSAAATAACLVEQIPVHQAVITYGSAYLNTAVSTLIGHEAAPAGQETLLVCYPIIVVHEEDPEAALGVLKFTYTATVDSSFNTVLGLMRLLRVADRWVAPACVSACCAALTALSGQSFSLEDIVAIYGQGPLPPSLSEASMFKPVLDAALAEMLQLFSDIPTVVKSMSLQTQLLKLPHGALVILLSSDQLRTDSEDTVLMLLSWWLEVQHMEDYMNNAQHKSELMEVVRYSCLSLTYLTQALYLAPKLCPSPEQVAELTAFHMHSPLQRSLRSDVNSSCPANWFKPPRPCSTIGGPDNVSLTLEISAARLGKYVSCVQAMEEGGPAPERFFTSVDSKGLIFTVSMESSGSYKSDPDEPERFAVFVSACVRLPSSSSMGQLPRGVFCDAVNFSLHSTVPGRDLMTWVLSPRFINTNVGWLNFPEKASGFPGDPLVVSWWDPFLVDGNLKIEVQLDYQRI